MKRQKIAKLKRVKSILDLKYQEDLAEHDKSKSRSLQLWMSIINKELPSKIRFNNNKELACFFRFFKFNRGMSETSFEGYFKRIIFYEYLGGFKNEKNIN
jgi:hypothetical protein